MSSKELLLKAFKAGFEQSAEGFNSEHMPNLAKKNSVVASRFEDWFSENAVEFECIDCGDHILRERHKMDIDGLTPKRCTSCTFDRMSE